MALIKLLAALLALLALCAANIAAAGPEAEEPESGRSAVELLKLCRASDPACFDYLGRMRAWMWEHPEKTGKLCESGHVWTYADGTTSKFTHPSQIATYYIARANNAWYSTASAHDAAIWSIQGLLQCDMKILAKPGDPAFPSH